MRRRLFTAVSVLSLAMCLTAAFLWMRGRYWYALVHTTHANDASRRSYGIATRDGRLHLFKIDGISGRQPGYDFDHYSPRNSPDLFDSSPRRWRFAGFRWHSRSERNFRFNCTESGFDLPLGYVISLTATTPVLWVVYARRGADRRATGSYCRCGYNLTGNTSGVCPECGTPTTAGVKT